MISQLSWNGWFYAPDSRGWREIIKPILLIVIGAVLLTGIVSTICFLIVRRKRQNADTNCAIKAGNEASPTGKKVKLFCLLLSGMMVLSCLVFVVIGALPRSDINDISPATSAKIKIASCFDTTEVIKVYEVSLGKTLQTFIPQLQDVLSQRELFVTFDKEGVVAFIVSGLERVPRVPQGGWGSPMFFDIANAKSLVIEGYGVVSIRNLYGILCYDPQYALILYDTDIGYVVSLYRAVINYNDPHDAPPSYRTTWFMYDDFLRYRQRDKELIIEEVNSWKEPMFGGPGCEYADPAEYNALNATLITEEKRWNNSHEAILYIIACAILHVALVCAIWYGGYRLYQKKRRSTPPADPNTEEAPQSGTE